MPNKPVHLLTGIFCGAAVGYARLDYHGPEETAALLSFSEHLSYLGIILISAAVGGQFGLMPDILEPAKNGNWKHRKFWHSYTLLAMLAWFTYQTETNPELHDMVQHFFTVAAVGYLSHLLLDSRTPAGLPWI